MAASVLLLKDERGMNPQEKWRENPEGLREEKGNLTPPALNSCLCPHLMVIHSHPLCVFFVQVGVCCKVLLL